MRLVSSFISISKLSLNDRSENQISSINNTPDYTNLEVDNADKNNIRNIDILVGTLEYKNANFHFERIKYIIFLKIYLFGDMPETCKKTVYTLEEENFIFEKIKIFKYFVDKFEIKNKYLEYIEKNENILKKEKIEDNKQKNSNINKFLNLSEYKSNELLKFSLDEDTIKEIANRLKTLDFYKIKREEIKKLFNTDEGYTIEFFDFIIRVLIRLSIYSKKNLLRKSEEKVYYNMAVNNFQKLYLSHYEFIEKTDFFVALKVHKDLIVQVREILSYIDDLID
ncbi:uncharacterized protein VNE69_02056 [Vairimorpha necatrix]|uniref:Uncharacterized protein n=1 Tax=Vairimorpha necatrix TaxID=6039 RepID=A0AAX4J970_9MICR